MFVISPIPIRQLPRGEFLQYVLRLGVEDPEERFVGEAGQLITHAVDIADGIAFREGEVGLEGAGAGISKGAGPGGVEWTGKGRLISLHDIYISMPL